MLYAENLVTVKEVVAVLIVSQNVTSIEVVWKMSIEFDGGITIVLKMIFS